MRKFIIKNYKNIGVDKEVSLDIPDQGGLCVILGENNAGKSNVLGALRAFGETTLTQSDIPNYSFSTRKNTQYTPEIAYYSEDFFGEEKEVAEDDSDFEDDNVFKVIKCPEIEKKFYGGTYSLCMNQNTLDSTMESRAYQGESVDVNDFVREFNELLLTEPMAFAYYGLAKGKYDDRVVGTVYICLPKMQKIICTKANNKMNTHTFEAYLIKNYAQAADLEEFKRAIPLNIKFKFYKKAEEANRAVTLEGLSDALELKNALEDFCKKETEKERAKSSLKGNAKKGITYKLSLENGKIYKSFTRASDGHSYKALFKVENFTINIANGGKDLIAKASSTTSKNSLYSTLADTKEESPEEKEDLAFLWKTYNATPLIFEFNGRDIKDSDLHIKREKLRNSLFFIYFFEKLGVSLDSIEEAYERKQREMELRGVSRAVKEKEDEINDLLKSGFTKRFNELYYGTKDGEKYNFQILLDEETISLMITRGKNSLALAVGEQSTGFKKFFGMFFDFLFQGTINEGDIVLIDEVETHLSIPVQREVRAFLKSFGEEHKITFVVTTHSNYIVDARNLDEVRIVRPLGSNKGTTIINDFSAIPEHQSDTLAEIKRALGVGAISLLNKDDRLIFVEGITDYSYLTGMYSLYQKENENTPKLLFLPICGLGSFDRETFEEGVIKATEDQKEIKDALLDLAFAAREDKAFLLCDGDRAGSAMASLASGDDNFEVATIREVSDFLKAKIKDVEDMFSEATRLKYHMVDKSHSSSSELKNDLIAGRYEPSDEEKANFKKLFDFLIERR